MDIKHISIISLLALFFSTAITAEALNSKGVIQLKKAGVSDRTIEIIAEEKVIETAAFSIDEIVAMKKAGVSERTLQMLVKEGSFLKNSAPITYGNTTRSIRFTTAQDVIELKEAGVSDEVIQAIIAVTGERYYSQQDEAYELLRDMDILIDTRRRYQQEKQR